MNKGAPDGSGALVTGCSRRIVIGFAIANRLAELGADLRNVGWVEERNPAW
jgi:NAD(P)-dependent dehydrogenase (short-subunit alcohol dehydrogenase family)